MAENVYITEARATCFGSLLGEHSASGKIFVQSPLFRCCFNQNPFRRQISRVIYPIVANAAKANPVNNLILVQMKADSANPIPVNPLLINIFVAKAISASSLKHSTTTPGIKVI